MLYDTTYMCNLKKPNVKTVEWWLSGVGELGRCLSKCTSIELEDE